MTAQHAHPGDSAARERGARSSQIRSVGKRVATRVAGDHNGTDPALPADYVVRAGRLFQCVEQALRWAGHEDEAPAPVQRDIAPVYDAILGFLSRTS